MIFTQELEGSKFQAIRFLYNFFPNCKATLHYSLWMKNPVHPHLRTLWSPVVVGDYHALAELHCYQSFGWSRSTSRWSQTPQNPPGVSIPEIHHLKMLRNFWDTPVRVLKSSDTVQIFCVGFRHKQPGYYGLSLFAGRWKHWNLDEPGVLEGTNGWLLWSMQKFSCFGGTRSCLKGLGWSSLCRRLGLRNFVWLLFFKWPVLTKNLRTSNLYADKTLNSVSSNWNIPKNL